MSVGVGVLVSYLPVRDDDGDFGGAFTPFGGLLLHAIVAFPHRFQPYRSRGVGAQVMKKLLNSVANSQSRKIDRIFLHVQVSNTDGKAFYERHGFKEVGVQTEYYKKIRPSDAWILEKVLTDRCAK